MDNQYILKTSLFSRVEIVPLLSFLIMSEQHYTYNLIQSTDNNKTEQHLAICIDIFFVKANQNAVKFVTYDLYKFQLRIPFQLAPSCYLRFSNNHLPGWIRMFDRICRGNEANGKMAEKPMERGIEANDFIHSLVLGMSTFLVGGWIPIWNKKPYSNWMKFPKARGKITKYVRNHHVVLGGK